jgi:hypothetical protein
MEVDGRKRSRFEEEESTETGIRIQNWIAAVGAVLILVFTLAN